MKREQIIKRILEYDPELKPLELKSLSTDVLLNILRQLELMLAVLN